MRIVAFEWYKGRRLFVQEDLGTHHEGVQLFVAPPGIDIPDELDTLESAEAAGLILVGTAEEVDS